MGSPALSFSAKRKRQQRDFIISGFFSSMDTFLNFSEHGISRMLT